MIAVAAPRCQNLEAQIQLRTDRRVRNLVIDHCGGRFIVRGQAPSVYVKQLALQQLVDVLPGGSRIDNRMTVARQP